MEFAKLDKWYDHNVPLKYLGYILIILPLLTSIGKKQVTVYLEIFGTEWNSLKDGKKWLKREPSYKETRLNLKLNFSEG